MSALAPALEFTGALWFGWSGKVGDPSAPPQRWRERGISYATIDLSEEQVHGHYEEFCNRVLWPLMHGIPDRASDAAADFIREYRDVNQRFAAALYPLLHAGDLVWVHDYHLIPMAAELRRLGWSGKVGYFHHIPIPDAAGWARIPYRRELALDLDEYDLIGTQTRRDADRLSAVLGTRVPRRIHNYPITIDADHFRARLASEEPEPLERGGGRVTFLGVDRLDYTKAIPERLRAFGLAAARDRDVRDGARFLQLAAPSRVGVPEYQAEHSAVEEAAAEVAEAVGRDSIDVRVESHPPSVVAEALLQADVCVVTSVADGMNLVAKEFAAVHSAEHPGVLILSDSCGAAEELTDALIYPAGDVEALAATIERAFHMPEDERRRRAARLRTVVDSRSSRDWFTDFVGDLASPGEQMLLQSVLAGEHADGTPAYIVSSHASSYAEAADPLHDRIEERLREFEADGTIERLWARDHRLWRPEARGVANRLGWLDVDRVMLERVDELQSFAAAVRQAGYAHVVLLGMGGSSLAPRVLGASFAGRVHGLGLTVLDSTVPAAIHPVEERAASAKTLFIVSSKSGNTAETMALLDYFWERHPRGRDFVAITDPGTRIEQIAAEREFHRVFLNQPDIGGRYSALSYTGLVPAVLMGIDIRTVLATAAAMRHECAPDVAAHLNPGARLGAALAEAALDGRDFFLIDGDELAPGFDAWLEQLIAESTGKEGQGILPVLGKDADRLLYQAAGDERVISMEELEALASPSGEVPPRLDDPHALGAEYFRWEFAVAVAGSVLGINPFDQPDVEASKRETMQLLEGGHAPLDSEPLPDVLAEVEGDQYVAVQAYLPRNHSTSRRLKAVRSSLAHRTGVPVTVEYGPSLLHSTGQYHKGGRHHGAFIQLVEQDRHGLSIPGRDYDFDELKDAQAYGDMAALRGRGRSVARTSLEELEAL